MKMPDRRVVPSAQGVVVLGRYIDALYVSIKGSLKDGSIQMLRAAKAAAKESSRALGDGGLGYFTPPSIPCGPLRILPGGRGKYEFVLKNEVVYLEVTSWANLPALLIQPMAHILYRHDLEELEAIMDEVAGFFLEPGFEVLVSRFDLALDFQGGEDWEPLDVNDVITKAREPDVRYRRVDGRQMPGCMTFGKSRKALQVQIYEKTEELKKSGKLWMYEVWRESGRYTEGLSVWRVEYRFPRKELHQLGVNTIADLRASQGELVRAVVGGEGARPWIRVAAPETRGRRQDHRPDAPWWQTILAASLEGMPATCPLDVRPRRRGANIEYTETMLFAYFERWMVGGGGDGLLERETSLEEFVDVLLARYRESLDAKGMSPQEAIEARRAKMGLEAVPVITR